MSTANLCKHKPMQRPPIYVRLIAIAITCAASGLGLLALYTRHAPARWTRFGYTAPLDGNSATVFGLSIFFFGLLPLMLTARSAKTAMVFGSAVGTLGVLSVFVGVRYLA